MIHNRINDTCTATLEFEGRDYVISIVYKMMAPDVLVFSNLESLQPRKIQKNIKNWKS